MKQAVKYAARAAILGLVALASFPAISSAEPGPIADDASCVPYRINIKPSSVTVIQETALYDNYDPPGEPVGFLAPMQSVLVKDVDREWNTACSPDAKWYLVETWLGDKWIRAGEEVMNGSQLTAEAKTITTVYETVLYDLPRADSKTDHTLSPQTLNATGEVRYQKLQGSNALSFLNSGGVWYRIETWLGEKWILNPLLLEDVEEIPLDYAMKLTGDEIGYPLPYRQEGKGELISDRVVQALAKWDTTTKGPRGIIAYKIRLPNGEIKWIWPSNEVIHHYRPLNEQIELPTESRYFDKPQLNHVSNWLQPGSYAAYEASGDWLHIRTPLGDKWVNPNRALQERPVGIVQTNEIIQLAEDTEYFRFPIDWERGQPKGFYAPQKVQAFEKWEAGNGDVWYRFQGFGTDVWVKNPDIANSD